MTNLKPIIPPDSGRARYSARPFPPYAFVPGLYPHPTENPKGHLYGKTESTVGLFDFKEWRKNENYLYGVDLYNFAYFWESHEALEGIWKNLPKENGGRDFFQGLIQISAAFLKWHIQEKRGAEQLYQSAMNYLAKAAGHQISCAGIDLKYHQMKLEKHFEKILKPFSVWPDFAENYPFIELQRKI